MADQYQQTINSGLRWISTIILGAFLGIIGFFLVTEHTAHVFGALPFVLLFGCLFMHLFMHGSHSGHGGTNEKQGAQHEHYGHDYEEKR